MHLFHGGTHRYFPIHPHASIIIFFATCTRALSYLTIPAIVLTMFPVNPPGVTIRTITSPTTVNRNCIIDLFLDFCCPYSKKLYLAVGVLCESLKDYEMTSNLTFRFQNVPQPWHVQGIPIHEMSLALLRLHGEAGFLDFTNWFWSPEQQGVYVDRAMWNLSINQIREKLIADYTKARAIPKEAEPLKHLLSHLETDDGGNPLVRDLKNVIRFHRSRGIHVSPTAHVNGIEASAISSSWTNEQWIKFLIDNNIVKEKKAQ